MHCFHCGRQIEEGSGFCPYCGTRQMQTVTPPPAAPVPPAPPVTYAPPAPQAIPEEPVLIPEEPAMIPEVPEFTEELPTPVPEMTGMPLPEPPAPKKAKKRFPVVAFILGLLLAAAVALSVYLYMENQALIEEAAYAREQYMSLKAENEAIQEECDRRADTIEDLEKKLDKQKKNNEDLQKPAKSKDATISQQKKELEAAGKLQSALVKAAKANSFGYASDTFRTNSAVYVVKKSNTGSKLTLWASWPNGGLVDVEYDGDAAWLNFDQDTWKASTTITIKPQKTGYTVVTFSNNVDSKTFSILIIVTD